MDFSLVSGGTIGGFRTGLAASGAVEETEATVAEATGAVAEATETEAAAGTKPAASEASTSLPGQR